MQYTIYPVTLTLALPPDLQTFTGEAGQCWDWLVKFGRAFDFVGELQYVIDGVSHEAYPYFPPNLYSITARYDTTFKRYTGATLTFIMHPAGQKDTLKEAASPYALWRRKQLQDPYRYHPKPEPKMMWD